MTSNFLNGNATHSPSARSLLLVLTCIFICCHFGVVGQVPILRINTSMHTDAINSITTDAEGRFLLTVSGDKTAKFWSATTGTLIRTLRTPIGPGDKGKLNAGALSPDGMLAAVGGYSYFDDKTHDVFVFDVNTGEMIQHIGEFKTPIWELEFSMDGNRLAVLAKGAEEVKIYQKVVPDDPRKPPYFEKAHEVVNPGVIINAVKFDDIGRLTTLSNDGGIRIYGVDFMLAAQTKGSGENPIAVAFSPSHLRLAVSYSDVSNVDVLYGTNLKFLFKAGLGSKLKRSTGAVQALDFSHDGGYLFGAGFLDESYKNDEWSAVRKWVESGNGSYVDFPVLKDIICDIRAMPNGDVVYCGTKPDFGRMDRYGNRFFYKTAEICQFTNFQYNFFELNPTGSMLAFQAEEKDKLCFDVKQRLVQKCPRRAELKAFETTQKGSGITVTDWEDNRHPKINGIDVAFIKAHELCRSVDIAPDGKELVFGTEKNLYKSDFAGKKIWETALTGNAWAVNVSENGKLVTAALDGGLINWYRMTDGVLILSLYIHPETEQWVLFTPSGFYDAAPGAERFLGWHLNNGLDEEALFYQASKFREKYYRPNVIDSVLQTLDEAEALRKTGNKIPTASAPNAIEKQLPPIISILDPAGNTSVTSKVVLLRYKAKSPGGEPIKRVRALVDGRPVEAVKGVSIVEEGVETISITIPPRDVEVTLLAENKHGVSPPASVSLIWNGLNPVSENLPKPTLYVLSIGVSDYKGDYDLGLAAKDATDFTEALKKQKGGLYEDVVVKLLTDSNATRTKVMDGLDWIMHEATSRDMAMIFLSGHGINDNNGIFYYMPHDADHERLMSTSVRFTELEHAISNIPSKVVLFADACHSGNILGNTRKAPNLNSLVTQLTSVESGAVVFTSSTGKQFSLEDPSWNNGAFTKALVEGLNGEADIAHEGAVSIVLLQYYITKRVKELTEGRQSPTVVIPDNMPDFPVTVVMEELEKEAEKGE